MSTASTSTKCSPAAQAGPSYYRAWFNQPSTLQQHHDLHGKRCIVVDYNRPSVRVFFTEGAVHSMEVLRGCLSKAA